MLSWKLWFSLASLTLALVSGTVLYNLYHLVQLGQPCPSVIANGLAAAVCITLSLIAWDIRGMGPADSYSLKSLLRAYVLVKTMMYRGQKLEKMLERSWNNSAEVQRKSLMKILSAASRTKYGTDKGLHKVTSVDEFRNTHPISTYELYSEYIEDIAAGQKDVMFPGKPVYFATTSGTTGKFKMYPKAKIYFNLLATYTSVREFNMLFRHSPKDIRLKKTIGILAYHKPSMTKIGLAKGPVSAMAFPHSPMYTIPEAGYHLTNTDTALHVNLVFSMRELDVVKVTGIFCSGILGFFQKMELTWKDICDDIEIGKIRDGLNIPTEKLRLLNAELKPNPRRAAQLREECRKGFEGIARRIWPKLVISFGTSTGVFNPAAVILSSKYLKGVPHFTRVHGGTEGLYGVNRGVSVDDAFYTLTINGNFYELLPIDSSKTILPEQAEIGKLYEMIVTTHEGLYRYRTSDVIEAVGFHGTTLVYKYSQRYGDVLNLYNEWTPVSVVEKALQSALRDVMPSEIITDFTCTESLHVDKVKGETTVTRYWIFVELDSGDVLPKQFADKVEENMRSSLEAYADDRNHGTAHPVKVVSLTSGTFRKLRARMLKAKPTASFEQFKTPRVTRQDEYIRVFIDNAADIHDRC